jgi:hypothetical protein
MYSIRMFANMSLAFSLEAHVLLPPPESWSGSAMDALDTIRGAVDGFAVGRSVVVGMASGVVAVVVVAVATGVVAAVVVEVDVIVFAWVAD